MNATEESVIRMANQIARNFAVQGDEAAIRATANHIALFWDPRMKEAIVNLDWNKLDLIAGQAIALLASEAANTASQSNAGSSD